MTGLIKAISEKQSTVGHPFPEAFVLVGNINRNGSKYNFDASAYATKAAYTEMQTRQSGGGPGGMGGPGMGDRGGLVWTKNYSVDKADIPDSTVPGIDAKLTDSIEQWLLEQSEFTGATRATV